MCRVLLLARRAARCSALSHRLVTTYTRYSHRANLSEVECEEYARYVQGARCILSERLVDTLGSTPGRGRMGCYLDVQHRAAPPSPCPHVTSTLQHVSTASTPPCMHSRRPRAFTASLRDVHSRAPLPYAFTASPRDVHSWAPLVICIHGTRVHSQAPLAHAFTASTRGRTPGDRSQDCQ